MQITGVETPNSATVLESVWQQMRAAGISNGVTGAPSWWGSTGNLEIPACKHDLLYTIGGTEEDRRKADNLLHDAIVILGHQRAWYWHLWPGLPAGGVADWYWAGVRMFGFRYFVFRESRVSDGQRARLLLAGTGADDGIVAELRMLLCP